MKRMSTADLPILLTRRQVLHLTGWNKTKFYEILAASPDLWVILPGCKQKRIKTKRLMEILGS